MENKVEEKLKVTYETMKPYIKEDDKLKQMCNKCENYCGKEHDYNECENEMCFKFYLSYKYLKWLSSYE